MTYTIQYVPSASKAIRKLDRPVAKRILAAIEQLAKDPRPPGCKVLKGGDGEIRHRIGDYRIIYELQDDVLVVLVLKVGHRRDVYR